MVRSDRASPCGALLSHFDVLLGMNANPVLRDDEGSAYLAGHVTADATSDAIHRAQTGMIRYCCAMAPQARFFRSGDQHAAWCILMRVVTVCARDCTGAFAPALAIS